MSLITREILFAEIRERLAELGQESKGNGPLIACMGKLCGMFEPGLLEGNLVCTFEHGAEMTTVLARDLGARQLCLASKSEYLISRQCQYSKQEMGADLGGATDTNVPRSEFIFQSAEDTFYAGSLAKTNPLGWA